MYPFRRENLNIVSERLLKMMNWLITFADRRATYSVSFRDSTLLMVMCPQQEKLTDNSDIQDPGYPMGIQNLYLFVFHISYCTNIRQHNLQLVSEMTWRYRLVFHWKLSFVLHAFAGNVPFCRGDLEYWNWNLHREYTNRRILFHEKLKHNYNVMLMNQIRVLE